MLSGWCDIPVGMVPLHLEQERAGKCAARRTVLLLHPIMSKRMQCIPGFGRPVPAALPAVTDRRYRRANLSIRGSIPWVAAGRAVTLLEAFSRPGFGGGGGRSGRLDSALWDE